MYVSCRFPTHTHTRVSELFADRVGVAFMQRPASGNISVTASLGSLTMNGRGQEGGEPPTIIQTNQQTAGTDKSDIEPLANHWIL